MLLQRYGRLAAATCAGALALTACGTDDNTTATGAGAPQSSTSGSSGASGSTGSTGASGGSSCPTGTLNSEGSSAQQNAMDAWRAGFQSQCPGTTINYNPTGSGAGIQSFTSGTVPMAGSDSALKPEEQSAAQARCQGNPALNLPMVIGPIAIAYNLEGVDDLQLKPDTLAKIFAGKITSWNDPAIAADNPGASLPDTAIRAVHRSDESGTTENFLKYLSAAAPKSWTEEPGKSWPLQSGEGAVKSAGVADAVKNGDGAIGYIEQSFAVAQNLSVAKIGVGDSFVGLDEQTAGAAIEAAQVKGQGNDLALELDYTPDSSDAYPIVLVTYEITCEKGLPADQAAFVKAFLTYTASDAGQQQLAQGGYAPLPDSMRQRVQQAVRAISAS